MTDMNTLSRRSLLTRTALGSLGALAGTLGCPEGLRALQGPKTPPVPDVVPAVCSIPEYELWIDRDAQCDWICANGVRISPLFGWEDLCDGLDNPKEKWMLEHLPQDRITILHLAS